MTYRIDIPGVGVGTAENGATESTLRTIAQLLGGQRTAETRQYRRVTEEVRDQASSARATAGYLNQIAGSSRQSFSNFQNNIDQVSEEINQQALQRERELAVLSFQFKALVGDVYNAMSTFATSYNQLVENPIATSKQNLDRGISLLVSGLEAGGQLAKTALGGLFGPLGKGVGGLIGGFADLTASIAGPILRTLNDVFGQELEATASGFRIMTQAGGAFSRGLTEVRATAFAAGTTVDVFSRGVQRSTESLSKFGLGMSGAMQKTAETMRFFDTVTVESLSGGTQSLRKQLFALGYQLEDQVALTADYLALTRSTMTLEQFRNIGEEELATSTANYAKNLRILEGITGKNAKAEIEKGRMAAMQGDILAQLPAEAGEKFSLMFAALPDILQKAVLQQMSLGAVLDPAAAVLMDSNENVRNIVNGFGDAVRDTSVETDTALEQLLISLGQAGTTIRQQAEQGNVAFQQLITAGISGVGADVGAALNELLGFDADPETIQKFIEALKNQGSAIDPLSAEYVQLQEQSRKFALALQDNVLPYLDKYAALLKLSNEAMIKSVSFAGSVLAGGARAFTDEGGIAEGLGLKELLEDMMRRYPESAEAFNKLYSDFGFMKDMKDAMGINEMGIATLAQNSLTNRVDVTRNATNLGTPYQDRSNDQTGSADSEPTQYNIPGLVSTLEAVKTSVETLKTAVEDNEVQNREVLSTIAINTGNGASYQRRIANGFS